MTLRRFASLAGALVVAAIAALASYSHMRGLALRYGQSELIADLLPISVDGMMVVATLALGDGRRHRWSAWLAFWTGVVASVIANVLAAEPSGIARCISAWPAVAFLLVVEVITRGGRGHIPFTEPETATSSTARRPSTSSKAAPDASPPGVAVPPARLSAQRSVQATPRKKGSPTVRRPASETRELAAGLRAKFPTITQAELARQLGISATRLRQVERLKAVAEGAGERARPIHDAEVPEPNNVAA